MKIISTFILVFLTSCGSSSSTPKDPKSSEFCQPQQRTADYSISIVPIVNDATNQFTEQQMMSFTGSVVTSHNKTYQMYNVGQIATRGMSRLALSGSSDYLIKENTTAKTSGDVLDAAGSTPAQLFVGNSVELISRLDTDHRYLSFAARIQPSPDWFVGLNSFHLCQKDSWVEKTEMNLFAYDAGGISSGLGLKTVFEIDPAPIQKVEQHPISVDDKILPVAKAVIELLVND